MYVNRVWGNTISKINQNVEKIFWIMLKMSSRGYLINVISFVNFYVERNLQNMLCEVLQKATLHPLAVLQ